MTNRYLLILSLKGITLRDYYGQRIDEKKVLMQVYNRIYTKYIARPLPQDLNIIDENEPQRGHYVTVNPGTKEVKQAS